MSKQAQALEIAGHSALSDLQSDIAQFEWLRSLMWAIKHEAKNDRPGSMKVIKDLADIGNYLAEDRAITVDEICKRLENDLDTIGGVQ